LLKDSEKLFYSKIQETKSQTSSLSHLIKQLWPVIKTRVKDPVHLMSTVNQCLGQGGENLIKDVELISAGGAQTEYSNDELKRLKSQHQADVKGLQMAF